VHLIASLELGLCSKGGRAKPLFENIHEFSHLSLSMDRSLQVIHSQSSPLGARTRFRPPAFLPSLTSSYDVTTASPPCS